mmetsp:Transcript_13277/g.32264  ORF Transcript_13277/g.32264 Transcript_13277/m.32264 type:complete len:269 (+) Transcript_13277:926-1732(+)
MALSYASGDMEPEPTWKDTPATLRPSTLATSSSRGTDFMPAPYLLPNCILALGSSARIRRTTANPGTSSSRAALILCSSDSESKVVSVMPCSAMQRRSIGRFTGCARMMRLAGTPRSRTSSTSPAEAQSKPAPSAASVEMTPRSGRHFTAKCGRTRGMEAAMWSYRALTVPRSTTQKVSSSPCSLTSARAVACRAVTRREGTCCTLKASTTAARVRDAGTPSSSTQSPRSSSGGGTVRQSSNPNVCDTPRRSTSSSVGSGSGWSSKRR